MEPEIIMYVCFGAIALDRVLSMLKGRGIDLQKMSRQTDSLYDWHNVRGEDGVPVWYVRKSLEEAMITLADNLLRQTEILNRIYDEQKDMRREMKEYNGK